MDKFLQEELEKNISMWEDGEAKDLILRRIRRGMVPMEEIQELLRVRVFETLRRFLSPFRRLTEKDLQIVGCGEEGRDIAFSSYEESTFPQHVFLARERAETAVELIPQYKPEISVWRHIGRCQVCGTEVTRYGIRIRCLIGDVPISPEFEV